MIKLLSKDTIDKIAAGEVVERPSSIVKELMENAIDAGATSVTVEIKDGGVSLIRVTDNGCGVEKDEVKTAFLRHATSKIDDALDLMKIHSLGFRGEALSSISAVTRCEIITKTRDSLTGTRYVIEGGDERAFEEVGAPDGTTIITRDLFFNTPVRRKFLKSAATETSHIAEIVEKIALSHPDVAIRFISNNQTKLQSSGNGKLKDVIYSIYGRDITAGLIELAESKGPVDIYGYIGKPELARANRNLEICFINGRYVKSGLISKAIETGYGNKLMQHQYPLAIISINLSPDAVDVNVHPTKMDVRFSDTSIVYDSIVDIISSGLQKTELIRDVAADIKPELARDTAPVSKPVEETSRLNIPDRPMGTPVTGASNIVSDKAVASVASQEPQTTQTPQKFEQVKFADIETRPHVKIIGQVFDTYWIIEWQDQVYIIDQHAAHEKVMYEKLMDEYTHNQVTSQRVDPPMIITLTDIEMTLVEEHMEEFTSIGYELEPFGGKEYAIRAIPDILPSVVKQDMLKQMIGDLSEDHGVKDADALIAKTASLSCKAAIKGGQRISYGEAEKLLDELMQLKDPYNCPHGRPTIIKITKTDMEKMFKRIV